MATQESGSAVVPEKLLIALMREREVRPRALLLAQHVAEIFLDASVLIYVIENPEETEWNAKAIVGDVRLENEVVPLDSGTLGAVAERQEALLFSGSELAREDYAHIHARRTIQSLAYVPFLLDGALIGTLEVLSFDSPLTQDDLGMLVELVDLVAPAIASALEQERERNSHLQSISRLAQLYDLEKVFNSTLEMDDLLPIVAAKFREILNVQAVNLWLVKDEAELILLNRDGDDASVAVGTLIRSGDGIAGAVSESGEPILIGDPDDERLKLRNASAGEQIIFSVVAVPIVAQENQVGVVEALNKLNGKPFDDDDLFLLTTVAETAANALHNASLLQAERKVEILETLVEISKEITSTLNLDRVLQAIVNRTQSIIAFERAAIALEQRGALELKAISGMPHIVSADPQVRTLKDMLEWASISSSEIYVTQREDVIDDSRPETQAKFADYFSETGMRSFYALPLIDDQGQLGLLSFESSDPDFLTAAHLEIIKVLAAQATVALRNASLYREVPFINLLEPLLQRRRRFMAMAKHRQIATLSLIGALLLFFVFCPFPMRVSGDSMVASERSAHVQSELDGVVKAVFVSEGDHVKKGQILATLEDWNPRSDLAESQARYSEAMAGMNHYLSIGDGTEAGTARVKADYWNTEVTRNRELLERTTIRAPFDGVITTPHVGDSVGRHLAHGDTLADMVEASHVQVDVGVAESDVSLLRNGDTASIKLESFPVHTFHGVVTVVSPRGEVESDHRVFMARVDVPNDKGLLRPGMQGLAKISVGLHPAGYVLFRGIGMWVWTKLWSWFGW
ncbi:MAG: GAF domain-containing protein [Terriglobales bacterium]